MFINISDKYVEKIYDDISFFTKLKNENTNIILKLKKKCLLSWNKYLDIKTDKFNIEMQEIKNNKFI